MNKAQRPFWSLLPQKRTGGYWVLKRGGRLAVFQSGRFNTPCLPLENEIVIHGRFNEKELRDYVEAYMLFCQISPIETGNRLYPTSF
jgi:hypothetical protein